MTIVTFASIGGPESAVGAVFPPKRSWSRAPRVVPDRPIVAELCCGVASRGSPVRTLAGGVAEDHGLRVADRGHGDAGDAALQAPADIDTHAGLVG